MAYATPADLVTRYDAALLGDLAGDGQPADPLTSPRIAAALDDASGEVDAAARVGGRYSPQDLAALDGTDKAFLVSLVCRIALLRLIATRIQTIGEGAHEALRRDVTETLAAIRRGELLFGTPPVSRAVTPAVDGPTALEYNRLNLLPDRTQNYYPPRAGRLPLGR